MMIALGTKLEGPPPLANPNFSSGDPQGSSAASGGLASVGGQVLGRAIGRVPPQETNCGSGGGSCGSRSRGRNVYSVVVLQ